MKLEGRVTIVTGAGPADALARGRHQRNFAFQSAAHVFLAFSAGSALT